MTRMFAASITEGAENIVRSHVLMSENNRMKVETIQRYLYLVNRFVV